jgi:hypothetical protein
MSSGHISLARIVAYSLVLFAVAGAGLFFSLHTQADKSLPPIFMGPYNPSDYTIRIKTTPCFGECPVYDMTIDGQGAIVLKTDGAIRSTLNTDKPEFVTVTTSYHINKNHHLALIETLEKGGFPQLKPDYTYPVTDLPSTTISVTSARGSWYSYVYAVQCAHDAKKSPFPWHDGKSVPDVFCNMEDKLHEIACDTYQNGMRENNNYFLDPFFPQSCEIHLAKSM